MFALILSLFLVCGLSVSEEGDLGYGLHIGNAIDVFANYGDLSQVTQVVSADYEEEQEEDEEGPTEPFREKNIRVFLNLSSSEAEGDNMVDMNIMLCETFDDLLTSYFQNFRIEGTDKPWKAFMGDWIADEIMRTFGIEYERPDNCCYVLVKMSKTDRTVRLNDLTSIKVKEYVRRAIDKLNVSNTGEVRKFMKSYGTHYIHEYETGNFVYQVFIYKRTGYNILKSYIRQRNVKKTTSDNLRFYFSSYFLRRVGDIRIASGNKTIEKWARQNLRDSQYLYSRPSLLRLHYSPILAYELNELLDNKALLGLELKTLRPLFQDKAQAENYAEVVENDMKLWEVNA